MPTPYHTLARPLPHARTLFRRSSTPGLNRWKNPVRRTQLLAQRLVPSSP